MHIGKVTEITVYPIKSTKAISLTKSLVHYRGLAFDRRWMLVDEKNKFLSQRTVPKMALIETQIMEDHLVVSAPNMKKLFVPFQGDSKTEPVFIWKDEVMAQKFGKPFGDWFTEYLQLPCDLVFMPETSRRQVDTTYGHLGDHVSFADGYPILITTEQSLFAVNSKLITPIDMRRFRPNIVINTDQEPFAEDHWSQIHIGEVILDLVKHCSRCVLTTVDPDKGKKSKDGEPLRVLSTFRKKGDKIFFGQNAIPKKEGIVCVGDEVTLIQ